MAFLKTLTSKYSKGRIARVKNHRAAIRAFEQRFFDSKSFAFKTVSYIHKSSLKNEEENKMGFFPQQRRHRGPQPSLDSGHNWNFQKMLWAFLKYSSLARVTSLKIAVAHQRPRKNLGNDNNSGLGALFPTSQFSICF